MTEELPESRLLDDQDIAELDELLAQLKNEDALRLDGAHGLLTALAVGPERVPAERWLPVVLGQRPSLEDPAQAPRLLELLRRLHHAVAHGLANFAYDPIFSEHQDENGETVTDVGGWCEGFGLGVDLCASAWEQHLQRDPELVELLAPIVALGVDDGVFAEVRDADIAPLSESERDALIQRLPSILFDVMHYWEDVDAPGQHRSRTDRPPERLH